MNSSRVISLITSIGLKIAAIYYFFSILFAKPIVDPEAIGLFIYLPLMIKIILLLIFGLFLLVLEKMYFLILFFSSFILLPLLKILYFLSEPILELNALLQLSDEILIIAMSVYFMLRYFRDHKRKKYVHGSKKKHIFKRFFAKKEKSKKYRTKRLEEIEENQNVSEDHQ